MPVSSGKFWSNSVNASNPPAEAPMPTTRKWFGESPGSCVCLADIRREDVERLLRFNSDAFLSVLSPPETFLRGFDFTDLPRIKIYITPYYVASLPWCGTPDVWNRYQVEQTSASAICQLNDDDGLQQRGMVSRQSGES